MLENPIKIKTGDYVILQRQKYTKLQKFGNLDTTAVLGKDHLELRAIDGHPYYSTFKMVQKEGKGRNRSCTLQICSETEMRNIFDVLGGSGSGADNRNIIDDGGSQNLGPEDISKLREECNDSSKIIEKIVENSKTFNSKTEYSQEKYLKKKEKKYFEFVQIRQPSIRLLTEIFYRQDPDKIQGIRIDTLSQMISYSGVSAFGNYLLYESGTNGLLPAAFLNAMGADTEAQMVHMHPGNVPQKQAILALNMPEEQTKRCVSVNIYSVLREYYQGSPDEQEAVIEKLEVQTPTDENPSKKPRLDESENATAQAQASTSTEKPAQKWQLENKRACELMKEQFDSLIIAAKEHPVNITKTLLTFVKPSRPVVIFSQCKEVLMELYVELKSTTEVTNLHLTSNWLRMYQILPNRTHPEVNMNGNSGYLLCGYTIR
ncbi:tRNA (adenine(58)-N(1))-methyltransferase non-catalytic subunit TRM6 [Eupeodes corollae]|uniref:tRNA (adenine(58)-N(1))-methyltransferase non-catalytic subunit TRM6 n=1 Tax=Eupeodes corollae TaxID=290404 RepID=UPI0024911CED|nr:tRNA (adenine(58)-N(1))-methyltransferase non-catalytic subunit TRM6 [Eupeodes corollae]